MAQELWEAASSLKGTVGERPLALLAKTSLEAAKVLIPGEYLLPA